MRSLALIVGTIAARLRRGSVGLSDPLKLVRPGLLGFVGIPLKGGSGDFIAWGTPRFGGEAIDCFGTSSEGSGSLCLVLSPGG